MSVGTIVLIIILVALVAALIGLYFYGKKLQKKQAENEAQIEAAKQPVTMLIIDKKRLKIKDAGLPSEVYQQTPWYLKRSKLPIVKAKVGPQIMNLVADERIFDMIPVKKQVKAMVSGMYIVEVKGAHGQALPVPPQKKKGFIGRFMDKVRKAGGADAVK
ncbi:MAG: hypothetical protein PUC46_08030 [Lachnospiraceae bacterium]|nr:hypothetical protein [Lachnospiraceae bacterium]